jgi:hypothetical protein
MVIYAAVYFTAVHHINNAAAKSIIHVKNKHEVVKELVYLSRNKKKTLSSYNLSFLTMADFLEKNTANMEKNLHQIKLSSLKTYENKTIENKITLLKQQTNDVLFSLMLLNGVKNKVSFDSELIDAYLISKSIDVKNYKKETPKLFKQLAVVFNKF